MSLVSPTPTSMWSIQTGWADIVEADEMLLLSRLSPAQRAARAAAEAADVERWRADVAAYIAELASIVPSAPAVRVWTEDAPTQSFCSDVPVASDRLWFMPFARHLESPFDGYFLCNGMCEVDYASFMKWLHIHGYAVTAEGHRNKVHAVPRGLPPVKWVSTAPPPPATIPRFCVKCDRSAPSEGCQYEHGDVIHRLNEPCKFGDGCKGTKRAACIRMHDGEVWTPELVIHRH